MRGAPWILGVAIAIATAACGPTSSGGGGDDGGSGSGGDPNCTTACWKENARPVSSPTTMQPPKDVTIDQCNPYGLARDTCPSGWACTGKQVTDLGGAKYTQAICEPTVSPLSPLVFDLAPPPPTGVAVTVHFTMNHGAWPSSSGTAGTLTFRARALGPTFTAAIPTTSSDVVVTLPPGVYDGTIAFGNATTFDSHTYPSLYLSGILTVVAAGTIDLDVAATRLTYDVRLDGAPLPAVKASEYEMLTFAGMHGQNLTINAQDVGARLGGTIVLEPDTYQVQLRTASYASPRSFPNGAVIVEPSLAVAGVAMSHGFATQALPIAGSIRVDGADLSANVRGSVHFGDNELPISTTRPASYGGTIYPGTYDVVLDTTSYDGVVPTATVRLRTGFTAGPARLDLDAPTTRLQGTITLNGGAVPSSSNSRGWLELGGATGSQNVYVTWSGDATFDARVYAGHYDVELAGEGPLPTLRVPLQADLDLTRSVTTTWNVQAGLVTLTLTDDGRQPPDASSLRGHFDLSRSGATPGATISGYFYPPNFGPVTISQLVPAGTWTVAFTTESDYPGLPGGQAKLGTIDVTPAGVTRTYAVKGVTITGELRRGGVQLPDAASGHTRGAIELVPAGQLVTIPSTGPATFTIRTYPGVGSLYYDCRDTCAVAPPGVYLLDDTDFK